MGGGLMQLVAYGAQDIYLTGNPQITFFKVVYRRHTNFSMEAIPQVFDGTFGFGKTVVCTVPRNGDLVHRMYVKVQVGTAFTADADMRALLKSVELEIGGQRIDKQYYRWQVCWQDLTYNESQKNAMDVMAGLSANSSTNDTYYLPLDFWFCRNPGCALPLIALQYHEVKVRVEIDTLANMPGVQTAKTGPSDGTISSGDLLVDYIYLDTDERRRFAQVSHEYLIEQVQFTGAESISQGTSKSNKINLHFNHPVKELIWYYGAGNTGANTETSYINTAKLQLNGHDRFKEETGDYFAHVQRFQHHTGVGLTGSGATKRADTLGDSDNGIGEGVYCYSFGLRPEEHQPSGTCNFSRIDNAVLNLTTTTSSTSAGVSEVHVFAHSYNVLRVMSGMGGLAYSN